MVEAGRKHSKHFTLFMPLPGKKLVCHRTPEMLLKGLSQELNEKSTNLGNCPTCGALPFDICFEDGERKFFFTCWKITENDNVLAETDYKKFASYCRGRCQRTCDMYFS